MAEQSDKFVIQLYVGRQMHSITIQRDQEGVYRKAARLISDKLGRYEQSYPNLDPMRYMSVALLDFAVQALQLEKQKDLSDYPEMINRLTPEIDSLLKEEK